MAHPVYYIENGQHKGRTVSVTTVLSRFKDSGALMHWSFMQGVWQGKEVALGEREEHKLNRFEKATEAAEVGTVVHEMVELDLAALAGKEVKKDPLDCLEDLETEEQKALAEESYTAYCDWAETNKLECVASEVSLVNEEYGYGGTVDHIMSFKRGDETKLAVLDVKTSKGVYPDMIIQVAAYAHLWHHGKLNRTMKGVEIPSLGAPIDTIQLLRLDKETGGVEFRIWPPRVIEKGWLAFQHMLKLYELDKFLKRAA